MSQPTKVIALDARTLLVIVPEGMAMDRIAQMQDDLRRTAPDVRWVFMPGPVEYIDAFPGRKG